MQNNEQKYTKAALGRFRKGLLKILQDGPAYECYGVCYNLNFELRAMPEFEYGEAYGFVGAEAYDWPHALHDDEGSLLSYFVPDHGGELWKGANLKMRQNLIQYLLGRVAHHEAMLRGGVALAG